MSKGSREDRTRGRPRRALPLLAALIAAAAGMLPERPARAAPETNDAPGLSRQAVFRRAEDIAVLGRVLFRDPALSGSGRMSCATCHSPDDAYGPPNSLAVQLGGRDLRQPGRRAVPTLKYLQANPQFTLHYYDAGDSGDDSVDQGPTGGLTWDGRVDRLRDQARIPLFSPFEMANASAGQVARRVRESRYAGEFRRVFGDAVLQDDQRALAAVLEALEVYQQGYREFYPYQSKYDRYLAGQERLTDQEQRGLALFNDPAKGNCASCHISRRGVDGTPPQFTDFGYFALGAPRNPAIPANADPAFYDLGMCGPERTDLRSRTEYCGSFRTPTLRNVATRRVFFHNGVFTSLRQAVEFYVERDTNPARWYPRAADGTVAKFNDLPGAYRGNVNMDAPFGGRPGDPPALSAAEIDAVIAFLQTLTDTP